MKIEEIQNDLRQYILRMYNIDVKNKEDERLLLHEHLFKARDLIVMVWDMCESYGINTIELPPYKGNVTVNGIAEYLGSVKV